MKKLLLMLLTAMFVGQVWAANYDFYAECSSGEKIYYGISSNTEPYTVKVSYISYRTSGNDYGITTAIIPETVTFNGITYSVIEILGSAFYNCKSLKTVIVPKSVTYIGDYAFYNCSELTTVVIPNSVTNIGRAAFDSDNVKIYCEAEIKNADWSSSWNNYKGTVYWGVKAIITDEFVYNIKDKAPNQIEIYKYVGDSIHANIPSSVMIDGSEYKIASIAQSAFRGYDNLESITISKSNNVDFSNAELSFIKDGIRYHVLNKDSVEVVSKYQNGTNSYSGDVVIPSMVTAGNTFSVTGISHHTFYECCDLSSITIPNTITIIDQCTFYGCSSLTSISFPESITNIGWSAFYGCSNLTSISIPKSVASIDESAFEGCNNITTLTYNTNAIGCVFKNKTSLKTVIIGNDVTTIGDYAFQNCSNLTTINIPNSITNIGKKAFEGCDNIDYTSYDNAYYIGNDKNPYCVLIAAKRTNIETCEIKDGCRIIYDNAFINCSSLKTINIPNTIISMGNYIFSGCSSLSTIVIPNSVEQIGSGIFYSCTKLNSVSISNSVTSIGDHEFWNCQSLSSISIPESVKEIGELAFYGCKFSSIVIPDSITSIGSLAFYSCKSLISVNIGNSISGIGSEAFSGCNSLSLVVCHSIMPPTLTDDPFTSIDVIYVPAESVESYKAASIWKRKEILPFGIVSVKSDNETMGTILGDSILLKNNLLTITATPKEGYHFVGWSDGNKDNPRTFTEAKDTTVVALFGTHTIVTDSAVTATCTEPGLTEGTHCSVCGEIVLAQEVVPANGHTEVKDAAIAPTCTKTGLTEGKHCSVCNVILVAQEEIPANGHTEVKDAVIAPTCTKTGLTEGKHCSVCNVILVAQEEIPANGHTEVTDAAVAATCTKTGLTEGKHCSVCNAVLVEQTEIPMVEHTIVTDAAVAATASETGLTEGSHCSVCGAVIVAQGVIPALGENQGGNNEGNENQGGENNPGTAVAESAANAINIYAHGNTIIVENATEEIRVYDAMGKLICRDAINRVRTEINVNGAGLYIVKVGNVAKRVMVN
ncbi:MAG: leucine-rich repeat protein [Salinivirgaceae bacterium]|nr:leucine-rich repeat protein [Salinivirgaceae bacterium]